MRFIRALATTAVFAGMGLGLAGPASAAQVLEGVYTYTQDGMAPATLTIYPVCVPTVGDLREPLELPVACTLHITGSTGVAGGDARLAGGRWTYSTTNREGIRCDDGSWQPIMETYVIDDVTMTGTRSISHNAACGKPPTITKVPFTLAFVEPLPIPVDRYPLDCQPGGLRLCR